SRLVRESVSWSIVSMELGPRRIVFDLLRQETEPGFVVQCHIGQDFAVECDSGGLQTVDELAVRDSVLLARSRNAHNPKRAEVTLLLFPADVGELQPALDGFLRSSVQLALG